MVKAIHLQMWNCFDTLFGRLFDMWIKQIQSKLLYVNCFVPSYNKKIHIWKIAKKDLQIDIFCYFNFFITEETDSGE